MFKFRYGSECDNSKPCSSNKGRARIDSIVKASKIYRDDLHVELEQQVEEDENLTVYYHRNCVSRYTSSSNTAKHTPEHSNVNDPPVKKARRSQSSFDFFSQCLYCGERCDLSKDPNNPNRRRPAFICRSTVSDQDQTPYKQYIIEKCASRDDAWAEEIRSRVVGSVSDLHAAEARYHRDCMCRFFAKRQLPTAQEGQSQTSDYQPDMALKHVITTLSSKMAAEV